MKTAIIFDLPDAIYYAVVEGDMRHLHEVYSGGSAVGDLQNELNALLECDSPMEWNIGIEKFQEAILGGAYLIQCGVLD